MEFNKDNIYIIVEDFYKEPSRYILLEESATESQEILNRIATEQFLGKGIIINLCRPLGPVDFDLNDENYELVLSDNNSNYSFEVLDCLLFPRIEGNLTPSIYPDNYLGVHYELKEIWDLSELFSRFTETGRGLDEFKILCHKQSVEIIDIENGIENTYKTIPAYPFSYFDLYCPICSKKIISYESTESDSIRCSIKKIKCEHYIGLVEKENGRYLKESFEYLQLKYRTDQASLFLMTTNGWKKAVTYTPSVNPLISHWGASGGKNFTDVFLFLELK